MRLFYFLLLVLIGIIGVSAQETLSYSPTWRYATYAEGSYLNFQVNSTTSLTFKWYVNDTLVKEETGQVSSYGFVVREGVYSVQVKAYSNSVEVWRNEWLIRGVLPQTTDIYPFIFVASMIAVALFIASYAVAHDKLILFAVLMAFLNFIGMLLAFLNYASNILNALMLSVVHLALLFLGVFVVISETMKEEEVI